MKVADLFALLSIKVDKDGIKKIDKVLDDIKGKVEKAALAFGAATTGMSLLVEQTTRAAQRFIGLEDEVGVNAQAMQGWAYAAESFGLELDNVVDFMGDLTEKAVEAKEGNENFAKAFKKMGVQIKDGNGQLKDTETLALEVADAFSTMEDTQKRTQLTMMLFSDEGRKLIPLLSQGSAGIKAFQEEAAALGGVLDNDTLESMYDARREIDRVHAVIGALKTQMIAAALPAIKKILAQFLDWIKANRVLIKQNLAKFAIGLVKALQMLGKVFIFVAKNARILIALFISWKSVTLALAAAQWLLGKSAEAAGAKMLLAWLKALAPVIAMIALVIAIALLIEDIWVAINGGESVVGEFAKFMAEKFWDAIEAIKGFFSDLFEWIEAKVNWLDKKVFGLLKKVSKVVRKIPGIGSGFNILGGGGVSEAVRRVREQEEARQAQPRRLLRSGFDPMGRTPISTSGRVPIATGGDGRRMPVNSGTVINNVNNIQTTDPAAAAREAVEGLGRLLRATK